MQAAKVQLRDAVGCWALRAKDYTVLIVGRCAHALDEEQGITSRLTKTLP